MVIKLYILYLPKNSANTHFKQEKPSSGGEWLVPSALFLLRVKSFIKTKGTQCTSLKSRVRMASWCCGPSGWRILTGFPPQPRNFVRRLALELELRFGSVEVLLVF